MRMPSMRRRPLHACGACGASERGQGRAMVVVFEPATQAHVAARQELAEPAIELRGVSHRYASHSGPVAALASIDLTIARGSFVAIVGPSGCGKTTLLRALS